MIRPINLLHQITLHLLIATEVPVHVMNHFRKGLFACPTCLQCCRDKDKWSTALCHFPVCLDQPLVQT